MAWPSTPCRRWPSSSSLESTACRYKKHGTRQFRASASLLTGSQRQIDFSDGERTSKRHPYDHEALLTSVVSLNVVVDFTFALFPLLLLRQVQIQRKVRLAIYLLLSCGLLAAVCSIGRVVASDLAVEDITCKPKRPRQRSFVRGNFLIYILGDLVPLTYWALSETSGVLILACMPAMHQLFKHTKHLTKSKLTVSKNQSNQSKVPERRINDTDSRRDLIFSQGNIRMQKDVYVELSARGPYLEGTPQYFELDESPHHNSAQVTADLV